MQFDGYLPARLRFLCCGVCVGFFVGAMAGSARADPAADVAQAVKELRAQPSYAWTVSNPPVNVSTLTARSMHGGQVVSTVVSVSPDMTGRAAHGLAEIEWNFPDAPPMRILLGPKGAAVADLPQGWFTADDAARELLAAGDETVSYRGADYPARVILRLATLALKARTPVDELPGILFAVVHYTVDGEEITGELSKEASAAALGSRSARAGAKYNEEDSPPIDGQVIFRFSHGQLREYEINIVGGADLTRGAMVHQLSMHRITTFNYGSSTSFDVPDEARKKLTP
jgi:hypothetical protein